MCAKLTDVYKDETKGSEYRMQSRDYRHVSELLALSPDDDEILFKWRTALRCSFDQFHTPKTRTLGDLVRDWNAYTAVKAGAA